VANARRFNQKSFGGKAHSIDKVGNWCITLRGQLLTRGDTQYMQPSKLKNKFLHFCLSGGIFGRFTVNLEQREIKKGAQK